MQLVGSSFSRATVAEDPALVSPFVNYVTWMLFLIYFLYFFPSSPSLTPYPDPSAGTCLTLVKQVFTIMPYPCASSLHCSPLGSCLPLCLVWFSTSLALGSQGLHSHCTWVYMVLAVEPKDMCVSHEHHPQPVDLLTMTDRDSQEGRLP